MAPQDYTEAEALEALLFVGRFGPSNAWTGTGGTAARMIGRLLKERQRLLEICEGNTACGGGLNPLSLQHGRNDNGRSGLDASRDAVPRAGINPRRPAGRKAPRNRLPLGHYARGFKRLCPIRKAKARAAAKGRQAFI